MLAVGSHEWENQFVDRVWTYSLDDVWAGLQAAYADLVADVERRYGVRLDDVRRDRRLGDDARLPRVRRRRRAARAVPHVAQHHHRSGAAPSSPSCFGTNIPLRWSIAHLHQAVLDDEPHVPEVRFLTTLAGYVHWQLTGRKVLGVGDASGMFPIDSATKDYDARAAAAGYDDLVADRAPGCGSTTLLPEVLVAGQAGRRADRRGRRPARPDRQRCSPASRSARPRATPAPAWSRRTRSRRAPAT